MVPMAKMETGTPPASQAGRRGFESGRPLLTDQRLTAPSEPLASTALSLVPTAVPTSVPPTPRDSGPIGDRSATAPALAGEGKQVFVGTGVTPDAREPVLEDAAGKERVRDLRDHGAPRAVLAREALVVDRLQAVEMILHQPEQRRRLRTPGLVDAEGHRRRVCCRVCHVPHARSPTMER